MKAFLIQLAVFAGMVATMLVSMFVANRFGLHKPWPMLIGIGSFGLLLFVFFLGVVREQRKELTVLAICDHPIFGQVRRLMNHWEASVPLSDQRPAIELRGEGAKPTPEQASTFTAIRDRYPELLARTIEASSAFFGELGMSVSATDLDLDSIYLATGPVGTFDLTFSAPAHEKKLPWGLSASFHDFAVDEISDNH